MGKIPALSRLTYSAQSITSPALHSRQELNPQPLSQEDDNGNNRNHCQNGQDHSQRIMPPPEPLRSSILWDRACGQIHHQPVDEHPEAADQALGLMVASASDPVIPNSNNTLSGEKFQRLSIHAQATNIGMNTTTL